MNTSESLVELDVRDNNELASALINSDIIINKSYLNYLSNIEPVDLDESLENIDIGDVTRCFKVTKIVHDKDEDSLDKLISVINAVGVSGGSIATIIKSNGKSTEYYLCVINKSNKNEIVTQGDILEGTFKGNFNGSKLENLNRSKIKGLMEDIFDEEYGKKIVSSVAGIGSLRNAKKGDGQKYVQGLEKFVESVSGQTYTAILLGDPISKEEIDSIRAGYEGLYSQIVPFLDTSLTLNDSDTLSFTKGESESISNSINKSISLTNSKSETSGWNKSYGESITKQNPIKAVAPLVTSALFAVSGPLGGIAGDMLEATVGALAGSAISNLCPDKTTSETSGTSGSNTTTTGENKTEGSSSSNSKSTNSSESNSMTRGRTIQIKYENKRVKSLLEKIDIQLKRLNSCEDFGGFNFSAYVISNSNGVNNSVACAYNSLMRGENSSVETSIINTWKSEKVNKYISKFTHPIFNLVECGLEEQYITPTSIVSGKELAINMALPKKSIVGLPVVETVSFGRNIFKSNSNNERKECISIGNIYHMGEVYPNELNLDIKSLSMHTFITGSTGAGKSNTIYKILDELNRKGIKFLVVEPAKGEYKNVFGHRKDVKVYGTNPKKNKLLRINPFAFNEDTHILEHIDRLIEIFNVCWPMYAAMPAVLKEAVEEAYKSAGWDLNMSENIKGEYIFPCFEDVLEQLSLVINNSAFSDELKGNYIGSLVTRVKSLTNGINGLIFSNNQISDENLFDENVIVDLSRVGSIETKSLIMGILITKLQEYRMAQGGMNIPLKHITVLEEAHNILKRTSTEQSSEGSNMVGKSVEMLSNAIAEIRTYGEGFIIADQSPGMLDMAAIRNTNTKIVLRLPEESDRELVGKAIGLSKDKIQELSKLETGVAAIYQNDWIEAVLCKIEKSNINEEMFVEVDTNSNNIEILKGKIANILIKKHLGEKIDFNIDILNDIRNSNIKTNIKQKIIELLKNEKECSLNNIYEIIASFNNKKDILIYGENISNVEEWNRTIIENMDDFVKEVEEENREIVLQCILREKLDNNDELQTFYGQWVSRFRG
ncbi:ATP-binding protein [Clostridium thermobutyricum]